MLNAMAWLLFASPLIITAALMIRGAFTRRAEAKRSFEQQRFSSFAPGPYFSSRQNRDRAMTS
jgi:hypothetical protein